jgi:hypothetical protein
MIFIRVAGYVVYIREVTLNRKCDSVYYSFMQVGNIPKGTNTLNIKSAELQEIQLREMI